MLLANKKHFSFDFDYTLADSSEGIIECTNYALLRLSKDIVNTKFIESAIGLSLEEMYKKLSGDFEENNASLFKTYFLKKSNEIMVANIVFYRFVPMLLETIKMNGGFISIVSTKHRSRIVESLVREGLDSFVDLIVGGDEVAESKPNPEGLLFAIRKSGIPKNNTVYVGDSMTDAECSYRASVDFISVESGQTPLSELKKYLPIASMKDAGELVSIL